MVCFNCNSNCRNGSYKCWNCGRVFHKKRSYVKQINIQKNYCHNNDEKGATGKGILLGLVAAVGGFLYLTSDKN